MTLLVSQGLAINSQIHGAANDWDATGVTLVFEDVHGQMTGDA